MKLTWVFISVLSYVIVSYVESIGGGVFVSITEAPYYASIVQFGSADCGATIISDQWLLTAAHCITPTRRNPVITVRTGVSIDGNNYSIHEIETVIVHGRYSGRGSVKPNDIALMKLREPLLFNEYQQPIKISLKPPKLGDELLTFGLGSQYLSVQTRSPVLKKGTLEVIDRSDCGERTKERIFNSVFCAASFEAEICSGDSGGPAVINRKLAGVTSFTILYCRNMFIERKMNVSKPNPSAYTTVYNYLDWIAKHTKIHL